MMKKAVVFFLISVIAFSFISCSVKSNKKTIKLSLILDTNSDWYKGAQRWQEFVKQASGGKIAIRIYPLAQLASHNQRTELEMLQSGIIDASLESTILLSTIDRRFSVFSLPWLFQNHDQANAVCDSAPGRYMLSLLPDKNIVGLAYGVNGFRQITNSKHPIKTPDDLKNMKIRVPSIKMYIEIFKELGADPSVMNFGELFQALQTGIMDGQENPLSVINSAKLYEVQKYITIWNYSYDPIIVCFNKQRFNKFSPEEQEMLRVTAKKAFDYERELVKQSNKTLLSELQKKGLDAYVLNPQEIQQFKEKVAPIYKKYKYIIGERTYSYFVPNEE